MSSFLEPHKRQDRFSTLEEMVRKLYFSTFWGRLKMTSHTHRHTTYLVLKTVAVYNPFYYCDVIYRRSRQQKDLSIGKNNKQS